MENSKGQAEGGADEDVGLGSAQVHSDVRELSFEGRYAALREALGRSSELPEAERAELFARARAKAESALAAAESDDERVAALALWAELEAREADGSERLASAAQHLKQALGLAPQRAELWRTLTEIVGRQAAQAGEAEAQELWAELVGSLRAAAAEQAEVSALQALASSELARRSRGSERSARFGEALRSFELALARTPQERGTWLDAASVASEAARSMGPAEASALLRDSFELLERGEQALASDPNAVAELCARRGRLALQLAKLVDAQEREACFESAARLFRRATELRPQDGRGWEDAASALAEHAQHSRSLHARELLREAVELLERGLAKLSDRASLAALHNRRGLTLSALSERSPAAESGEVLEQAHLEFERAIECDAELEHPWINWAESLLKHATLAEPVRRSELRAEALELLWRGTRAMVDPKAAGRLSIERGLTLMELARSGTAAERDAHFAEAKHEFERAVANDPSNWETWRNGSDVLRAQASLAAPPRARALLEQALQLSSHGLRAVEGDVSVSQLQNHRGVTLIALAELHSGREREAHFAEAIRQFQLATRVLATNRDAWQNWAHVLHRQAQRADADRARELLTTACDMLSRGLESVGSDAPKEVPLGGESESALFHARGSLQLSAAELYVGSEREVRLDAAVQDFRRACDKQRTRVAAWRSWAAVFSARAQRESKLEPALHYWKQADAVLDAGVQALPLGEATAALLTDRGGIFSAQAKRQLGSDRRQSFEQALACFEEATQLAPGDGWAWQAWSRTLAARARFDDTVDALECYRLAAERCNSAAHVLGLDQRGSAWLELAYELRALARRDLKAADALVDELVIQFDRLLEEDQRRSSEYYFARGNLLRDAGRHSLAEADFTRGRDATPAREALFCQHNLSSLRQEQGRAKREWHRTQHAYESYAHSQAGDADAEVLGYWGVVLYDVQGAFRPAESKLLDALERRAASSTLFHLTYAELAKECAELEPKAQSEFADRARTAERFIRAAALDQHDRELALGKLALRCGDHERAQQHFSRALELDPRNSEACELSGLALLKQERFDAARARLAEAQLLLPRELRTQVYLAAAYAKGGDLEGAQERYRAILELAPHDVDALLGLADASITHADATNDLPSYERAIDQLRCALEIVHAQRSRRLRAKELAQAYYARGYCQVKLSSLEGRLSGLSRLDHARADFRNAVRIDRSHDRARRALAKLHPYALGTGVSSFQRRAGGLVSLLAAGVFALAQLSFWPAGTPLFGVQLRALEFGGYFALTFAALAFFAIGLYLPQLLKLKVAGIEIERSPLDFAETTGFTLQR